MTRRTWGAASGIAALLALAALGPAQAQVESGSGTIAPDDPTTEADESVVIWDGTSEGISPDGLCDDIGGESCFKFDLTVAEGLEAKGIHVIVQPLYNAPRVNYHVDLHQSEDPNDWEYSAGVDPAAESRHPANDFDIWLFLDGTRQLAVQPDLDNNFYGSYSNAVGPVDDEFLLQPGMLAAGDYDVVVVSKAAAPGSAFRSELRAFEAQTIDESGAEH